ncbi:MAG: hypothetical protein ACOYIR_05140 [Christensenellales bacterium]|jgi:acetolactate synthase-1/3 small subunit
MNLTPHLLTLEVDNEFGVLTRITAVIRREGFNISGLSVAELPGGLTARVTLSLLCALSSAAAVIDRLKRLNCVHSIASCTRETHAIAELALFRWDDDKMAKEEGCFLIAPGVYGFCGTKEEIDGLIERLSPKEVSRSGEIALRKKGDAE